MSDKLAELHKENARLRSTNARFRSERDSNADLIKVMAERLAKQGKQIAELKREIAEGISTD